MLSDRQVPKGVQTLKLQIEIFALETKKANKQTEKQNTCKKIAEKIGRRDIMDYFISPVNTHA